MTKLRNALLKIPISAVSTSWLAGTHSSVLCLVIVIDDRWESLSDPADTQ